MVNEEQDPYGYIYIAINRENGKTYIGQTVVERWQENQDPIKERWKEEVQEAYRIERKGEEPRYIENAIVKYGEESFELKKLDVVYNQKDIEKCQNELDEKETEWIKKYDSMNPDKGYNLKEGGRGGRLSEVVKEKISKKVSNKWQENEYQKKQIKERKERGKDPKFQEKMSDINRAKGKDPKFREKMSEVGKKKWQENEYQGKQIKERKERGKDPKFQEKMTKINRERAKTSEYQEKMSKSLKEKWQDGKYQESVSKGVSKKWQEKEYQEKQARAKREGKREISNKQEFLRDIQEMKKKDLINKYSMDGKTMNKRIKEMLGEHRVNNYSEAREYLRDKKIEDVVKEIEAKSKKDNTSEKQKNGLEGEKTEKTKDGSKEGDKKETKKESKDLHKVESGSETQKTSEDKTSEKNQDGSKAKERDKDKEDNKPEKEKSDNIDSKPAEHTPKEDVEAKNLENEQKDQKELKNQESELLKNDKENSDKIKDYDGINKMQGKNKIEKDYQKIKENLGQNKKDFECLRDNSKNVSEKDKKGNQRVIPTDKEFGGKTAEEKAALSKQKEQKKDYDKIKENRFDSKKDYEGIKESSRKERKDYDKIKEESE